MLEPIRHILAQQRTILCSSSPRRKEILNQVGLVFEVIPSNFPEDLDKDSFSHPCEYVKENAKQKAIEVWKRLFQTQDAGDQLQTLPDLIVGADTVVTMDNRIYEKPKDTADAFDILSTLSGRKHTVFTGVALLTKSAGASAADSYKVTTFHEATDVYMREMSADIIRGYIATGEPMDKAGGYGIQGIGATLIEGIKGDYFNVMGLPLSSLAKELYHIYTD
jgi:septum formation protein